MIQFVCENYEKCEYANKNCIFETEKEDGRDYIMDECPDVAGGDVRLIRTGKGASE